jgi:hypothetical protein
LYPPELEPYRELQYQAGDEQEVGIDACAGCRGNDAGDDEKRPQSRQATVERLEKMHERGFHIGGGMTLWESQFHLLAFLFLTITRF